MKYLVSILKEMNAAATGGNERRSEMSIHDRRPKGLGAASKRDQACLERNADTARDTARKPAVDRLSEKTNAVDIDRSSKSFFKLDRKEPEDVKLSSGHIESTEVVSNGLGLWFGGGHGKSFYGSVNKEGLQQELERLEKTPLPPTPNTLADQMRRGKRRHEHDTPDTIRCEQSIEEPI